MKGWNFDEYLNKQINKIKELKEKGYTDREIIDRNEFCYEALQSCNLPLSYLTPKIKGQEMDLQEWDTHTSSEHKWEYYNNSPFGSVYERDRVLIGLLYTAGFKHLLEILTNESIEELDKCMLSYKNKKEVGVGEISVIEKNEWDVVKDVFKDAINKKGLTSSEVKDMADDIEKELKDARIQENK